MKQHFTVFYSWQSDLNEESNKKFISDCIESAIKDVKKRRVKDIKLEINIDRDIKNKSGSPNISNVIFDKIKNSDIFVCDVTLINSSFLSRLLTKRLTPNPNVLIELGFAVNLLGWERIICINNLNFGKNEKLPFDLRSHRISTYNSSKKDAAENLKEVLDEAISRIVKNYDEINKAHHEDGFRNHDKAIFEAINDICTETALNDSISMAVNNLSINQYYYEKWDSLEDFYKKSLNRFLDKDLDMAFQKFINLLRSFRLHVLNIFMLLRMGLLPCSNLRKKELN